MSDPTVLKLVSSNRCFGGLQNVYEHSSNELKCSMKFAVYLPYIEKPNEKLPVLIWLSGLTCNEQNFITKSGFQRYAQEHKIIVVAPDTSPRGCNIEGESERWDFGVGAGFYINATEPKWSNNYRMYSYINEELHEVIKRNFNNDENELNVSIFGHRYTVHNNFNLPFGCNLESAIVKKYMGGHGALISFLKNPKKYASVSAFAPICNPSNCEWGVFAFSGYLGKDNSEQWKTYDATELVKDYNGEPTTILIDQGSQDNFLHQLLPNNLVEAGKTKSLVNVNLRIQEGYDHSYYFISTFIGDHFDFHAKNLKK